MYCDSYICREAEKNARNKIIMTNTDIVNRLEEILQRLGDNGYTSVMYVGPYYTKLRLIDNIKQLIKDIAP